MEHYELMRQGKDRTDPSFPTRRKVNLMMADEADEADEADPVGRALSEFMNALAGQNERELELFSCYHECFFVRLPSTTAPSTQPTTQRRQPTRHLMTDPTRLGVTADTDHLSATHERKLVTALTRLGAAVVYQPIIPHFGYDDFDTNLRIWKWRHQRGLPDATESENGKMDCLNELRAFNSGWAAKKYHDQLAFTHRILGKGLSRDSACLAYLSPVVIRYRTDDFWSTLVFCIDRLLAWKQRALSAYYAPDAEGGKQLRADFEADRELAHIKQRPGS